MVPNARTWPYEYLWGFGTNLPYLKVCAIINKFIDQAISVNLNYNPMMYDDSLIPMSEIVKDVFTAYSYGLKTIYYMNTYDANIDEAESGCGGGCVL